MESQGVLEDTKELKDLIKQRASLKGRLTIFSNYLATLKTKSIDGLVDSQINELNLRVEKLEALFGDYERCQNKIEFLSSALDDQIKEREITECNFYTNIADAHTLINSYKQKSKTQENNAASSSHADLNVKLPIIKLPSFDGNYFMWLEFRDTFESLIHNNDTVPDINKFHYLRSSLEGSAALVIKSIEFTSSNYNIAWDLLCQRYNNKKILINNHLKALCRIEPISKESHRSLRYLIDIVTKNLRALTTLGQPVDSWDALVIYMVSTKLDSVTSMKWEEYRNNLSDLPLLTEFIEFLRNRADILETTQANRNEKPEYKPRLNNNNNNKSNLNHSYNRFTNLSKSFVTSKDKHNQSYSCPLCSKPHRIIDCDSFKAFSVDDKYKEAKRLNLCLNCLRRGHERATCHLGPCRLCKEKHNTMLHKDTSATINSPVTMSVRCSGQVLLGTALIKVTNPKTNNTYHARALLDPGSQSSFMTENLKEKLNIISRNSDSIIISGINNVQVPVSNKCIILINSLTSSYNSNLQCLVVPQITSPLPNISFDVTQLNLPNDINYADPYFFKSAEIDLLLGADIFFDILDSDKISLGHNMPILLSTQLGWVVAGPLAIDINRPSKRIHCNFTKEIHDNLIKFWNLEEVSSKKSIMTPEEEFCEEHFCKHTQRKPDGRFSVLMPIKEASETTLGNSYKMAAKRFFNIEKRLNKSPTLKKQYEEFINEYENLGHLTKIKKPNFGYYLPHHAVIRETSETTKLRVVFDASAKTTTQRSLNDIQCIGPVVQNELFNILIRFRIHKYVMTGDIEKMYRQVLIQESQRHLQLILWREKESSPLQVMQLNTVTYGTSSAPFLSTRCLLQLAFECSDPKIADIIKNDIYMDDVLTGSDCQDDLSYIYEEVTKVLQLGCFPLHKIRTNCPQISKNSTLIESLDLSKQSSILGVLWDPTTDTFTFSINLDSSVEKLTKRIILSNTGKIFDPLGVLSACTVGLKILLQRLWQLKFGWDDPLPNDIKQSWQKIVKNIETLKLVSIPRCVSCSQPKVRELHCFVDASQHAYAACVYMRTENETKLVNIKLLCAKTRVAPLKTITIPRLELCAALLGARLVAKMCEALRCEIHRKIFWSDSTITLGWIQAQPKTLNTFVCNRISEIHELTKRQSWRHVPTDLNPADMASRGIDPILLHKALLWWEGPTFLKEDEKSWPKLMKPELNLIETRNLHTIPIHEVKKINDLICFENYSSSSKLKRIFAYVIRFIRNCRNKDRHLGYIQSTELDNSLDHLIIIAQSEMFPDEITLLKKQKPVVSTTLLQLTPFIDDKKILRVGGRLNNTQFNFERKHPILLQGKHHFTKLLMRAEHMRLLHAGPQQLLSSFRNQFWPLGGRTLARKIVRQCIVCARFRAKTMEPLMGQLPADRVTQGYPFQICGTDFAGPFLISSKIGRGNRISKCYLCVFVCFCTKAIHLEIVSDMSSNAFISCLRRFISRRGKPSLICCDNGTNFVGANNELRRVLQSSIRSMEAFTADEGIKFKFNPPYSPTFGGLWEAGVKSAKYHLKRIIGNTSLTYEELGTLCIQVEGVLNSRPLTPLSPDPQDLTPLTPGHFLIGRPLTAIPEAPINPEKRIKTRYQRVQALRDAFWKRWHNEYLCELQSKTKWRSPFQNIKEGELVVFKDNNLPPVKWKLGRIYKLYPGKDGVCRVADFRTSRGIERRALNKVCPLPEEEEFELPTNRSQLAPQDVYDNKTQDNETPRGARDEGRRGRRARRVRPASAITLPTELRALRDRS